MNFVKESPKMHFLSKDHIKNEFCQKLSKENANFGKGSQKTHKFKQRIAKHNKLGKGSRKNSSFLSKNCKRTLFFFFF